MLTPRHWDLAQPSYAKHSTTQSNAKPSYWLCLPKSNFPGSSLHQRPRQHMANEGPARPRAKGSECTYAKQPASGFRKQALLLPANLICSERQGRPVYILRPLAATLLKEAGHKPAQCQFSAPQQGGLGPPCSCADMFCTAPATGGYSICVVVSTLRNKVDRIKYKR